MMFIKTLATRTANSQRRFQGISYSFAGLYDPNKKDFQVCVCPEDSSLEGKTFAIEASRSNISKSLAYAKTTQKRVRNAIEAMDASCNMAKAKSTEADPQMLFFLPSAYLSGEKIFVNISPFSCRCPELPDNQNSNVRYPVFGYAGVDVFVVNVFTNITSSKRDVIFDMVDYFICKRNAEIHDGYLNNEDLFNTLAAEAYKNPLLDTIQGVYKPESNRALYNENAKEALAYQICVRDHPEITLYGGVCSLYDYKEKKMLTEPAQIREALLADILFALGEQKNKEIEDFVREKVYVRCISGFKLHDGLFDMRSRDQRYTNRRLLVPLYERCSYLLPDDPENKEKKNTNWACLPPLKRIKDEDKKHLYTIRSLSLQTPDGKNCCFPKGVGLVSIRARRNKEGQVIYYLNLETGFLTHKANEMTSRYSFQDTKCDLSDQAIVRTEILPLLKLEPEEAVTKCYELYHNAEATIVAGTEEVAEEEEVVEEEDVVISQENELPAESTENREPEVRDSMDAIEQNIAPSEYENLPF